ncbi:MAG: hypothetical protein ACD_61C00275G0005 [uncultured bacterium]|nr:MAG: hypothetical protein ACD_61C00275G0005 [uncultured bacterium]
MATINKSLAEELVRGNGKCKKGTAGYCLVRYQNRTKYNLPGVDLYDPEAKINCYDYAIFADKRKFEIFQESETVGGIDILWGSERFKQDEAKRELAEDKAELMEGTADFLNHLEDYPERRPGRPEM